MTDARDFKQLFKAILPILAVLNFSEVNCAIELSHSPTETNVILVCENGCWNMQNCEQEKKIDQT